MNYHNITYPDMNNGDGLRVVLWLSGCHHHCPKCQNQQTWNPQNGIIFDENAEKEIFEQLQNDYISGITLTGGDPMARENVEEVYYLIRKIRQKYLFKNIWLYTGYTLEEIFSQPFTDNLDSEHKFRIDIVKNCDILVDGRYIDALRDPKLHYRGSSNQRLIDMQKTLKEGQVVLWRA